MAVYQGARAPRTVVIPRGAQAPRVAAPEAPALRRRRMRSAVRARRGSSRISILLAVIVVLFASEARHYRTFVDLATQVKGDAPAVRARLDEIARAEGGLIGELGASPTVHG